MRPAVDGSGEDAIDSPPGVQGAVQHVVVDVQHVEVVQQAPVVAGQHVFVGYGQQGTKWAVARFLAFDGTGQHVGVTFGCALCTGQMMSGTLLRATLPAAPAGVSTARAHSAAASTRTEDGKIKRRIAESGSGSTRICEA